MTKSDAVLLIDFAKGEVDNPAQLMRWIMLRDIILQISDKSWEAYVTAATKAGKP